MSLSVDVSQCWCLSVLMSVGVDVSIGVSVSVGIGVSIGVSVDVGVFVGVVSKGVGVSEYFITSQK